MRVRFPRPAGTVRGKSATRRQAADSGWRRPAHRSPRVRASERRRGPEWSGRRAPAPWRVGSSGTAAMVEHFEQLGFGALQIVVDEAHGAGYASEDALVGVRPALQVLDRKLALAAERLFRCDVQEYGDGRSRRQPFEQADPQPRGSVGNVYQRIVEI